MALPCPFHNRWSLSSNAPASATRRAHEVPLHQLDGLLHRSLTADYRLQPRLTHPRSPRGIGEQLRHPFLEPGGMVHEKRTTRLEEELGALAEVGGVRAVEHGFSEQRGFEHVRSEEHTSELQSLRH